MWFSDIIKTLSLKAPHGANILIKGRWWEPQEKSRVDNSGKG